ncbi:hypothetical protein D3C85_898420 [compost metagenome]
MQADKKGVAAKFCGEQAESSLVVHIAGQAGTVFLANEVAHVGAECPVAYRLAVIEAEVLLLVDVLKFVVPQSNCGALFVERVFTAAEVESVRGERRFAVHGHVFHAGVVTRAVLPDLAAVQRQTADLLGGDLRTTKGLRQRTAIV